MAEPDAAGFLPARHHADLGDAFFAVVEPADFPKHVLRWRNDRWARRVGLGNLTESEWIAHFGRFEPLPGSLARPLALRYHGHQFRSYNPQLGDGRGFLFAQLRDPVDGRLLDLGTKGSGETPWSRGADGRLTLKGGVSGGYKTPTLKQADSNIFEPSGGDGRARDQGNTDLKPEESTNYEIGAIWETQNGVQLGLTAYHTRFPEYVRDRAPVPLALSYAVVRRFHAPAAAVMVATQSIEDALKARGFRNIRRWSRGVDTELFRPRSKAFLDDPRPITLYVGRVAVEKNLEAFLKLDLPGTKYVVGDGPQLEEYRRRYPGVKFAGARHGEELAQYYAAADVFVFPSRTDTFGLVLLEALASGVPVAAFPVPGPLDVLDGAAVGCLDEDLGKAVNSALAIPPERCREHALAWSWRASAEQFINNLKPLSCSDRLVQS